jgi:hypothetical protein
MRLPPRGRRATGLPADPPPALAESTSMSAQPGQRASELAAQQVEQIVTAAQAAAEEIRKEAQLERQDIRKAARREGEEAVRQARRSAQEELTEARKQAIHLGQDARRDAEALINDAKEEAAQVRDRARRAVEGRTAAAERAAADVLEEARALSSGLHQLGKALEDHANRILRDVQAAHKRMQADLRVGVVPDEEDPLRSLAREAGDDDSQMTPSVARSASRRDSRDALEHDGDGGPPRGLRRNPFEEIELPSWVGRES